MACAIVGCLSTVAHAKFGFLKQWGEKGNTSGGRFLKQWGDRGNGRGEFKFPIGIAVDCFAMSTSRMPATGC